MNDTQFKLLFLDTEGKVSFTLKLSYGNMDKYKSGFFRPMLLETPPFSIDVATPTGIASTPSGVHTGQIYDIAEKKSEIPRRRRSPQPMDCPKTEISGSSCCTRCGRARLCSIRG